MFCVYDWILCLYALGRICNISNCVACVGVGSSVFVPNIVISVFRLQDINPSKTYLALSIKLSHYPIISNN